MIKSFYVFHRYDKNLHDAKKSGVKRAMISGGGMGMVYFIMFGCYALAFWYGAKLIRDESENYTPGSMLIVSTSSGKVIGVIGK